MARPLRRATRPLVDVQRLTIMQKRVELWLWFIRDSLSGKLRTSRHRMTAEDAEALHPGCQRVPGSMVYADVELTKDAELDVQLADVWRSAPANQMQKHSPR